MYMSSNPCLLVFAPFSWAPPFASCFFLRMKKQLDNVVRKMLDDVEFAEVKDFPESFDLEFSIDLMEPGRLARTEVSSLSGLIDNATCSFKATSPRH